MTDTQLYLAIGLPVFAILMSIVAGILQHSSTGARLKSIESNINARLTTIESNMNARFTSVENRFMSLESRFDAHFS